MKPLMTIAAAGALSVTLKGQRADAIETIEAVGDQGCGGPVKAFEVEFLAPDKPRSRESQGHRQWISRYHAECSTPFH